MARGGGGLFMKLAPELLLVFLNYLYLHDIAKLRCVSRWFNERISSLMPSKFRRFKIRFNGKTEFSWKSILSMYCDNNYECVLKAMRKPNGHLNLLDVTVDGRCKKFNTIQKVLNDNKDNIAALHILPGHLPTDFTSFLQHESTRFKFLEKLTICKYENSNLGNLLTKHAEQLTYLKLVNFYPQYPTYLPNLPKSLKLKTVVANDIGFDSLISLLSSCSESLTDLSLRFDIKSVENINIYHEPLPELPKLQTLSLFESSFPNSKKIIASLISKCRRTLTGICFNGCIIREDLLYFPQVKCLVFIYVPKVLVNALIASHASQLETLILQDYHEKDYQNGDCIFPDLLPKLKNVWMDTHWVLPNLLKSAPILQCLVLDDCSDTENITKMPNLTDLTDLYLIELYYKVPLFEEIYRSKLFANINDTLEFLVYKGNRYEIEEIETPLIQLKKVHTVIVLNNYPTDSDKKVELDFFKSLCPNAQILTNHHGREYIVETLKLRLKYLKAHDIFIQQLGSSLQLDGIYCPRQSLK